MVSIRVQLSTSLIIACHRGRENLVLVYVSKVLQKYHPSQCCPQRTLPGSEIAALLISKQPPGLSFVSAIAGETLDFRAIHKVSKEAFLDLRLLSDYKGPVSTNNEQSWD
jgi:hypothetical protein